MPMYFDIPFSRQDILDSLRRDYENDIEDSDFTDHGMRVTFLKGRRIPKVFRIYKARSDVLEASGGMETATEDCASPIPRKMPFTSLDSYLPAGAISDLHKYLVSALYESGQIEKRGPSSTLFQHVTFDANNRLHAGAIQTQNRASGDWDFRTCRIQRGNPFYWENNENYDQLPGLNDFVSDLPFFEYTGKVQVIYSESGSAGVEHRDHNFKDVVSEFIWIRTDDLKQLYVRGNNGEENGERSPRYRVNNSSCIWFDDHFSHGIVPIDKPCFSIRIDGKFTPKFREHIQQVGVFKTESLRGVFGEQNSLQQGKCDL